MIAQFYANSPVPESRASLRPAVPRHGRIRVNTGEFEQLQARHERPYSSGHQKMYSGAVEILSGSDLKPVSILEVGTGIGFGLGLMLAAGIVKDYTGVEPDPACCDYLTSEYGQRSEVTIINKGWLEAAMETTFDYSFCIEVIEQVPAEQVPRFLAKLRRHTVKTLFLSAPDAITSAVGVAPTEEWKRVIRMAGFDVATIRRQWTTLFVCDAS